MHKSTSGQKTPSIPSQAQGNTTNPGTAAENQESALLNLESGISKFESYRIKHEENMNQFEHANKEKELHQAQLNIYLDMSDIIFNKMQPDLKSIMAKLLTPSASTTTTDPGDINESVLKEILIKRPDLLVFIKLSTELMHDISQEEESIENIKNNIDALKTTKLCSKKDLENSKIELMQSVAALQATKTGDGGEIEMKMKMKHLISFAHQKIAAADFSMATYERNHAKNELISAQSIIDRSSKKLSELWGKIEVEQKTYYAAQDEFAKNNQGKFNESNYKEKPLEVDENAGIFINPTGLKIAYIEESNKKIQSIANHTQAQHHLTEMEEKFSQAENILKESNSAMENAQSALDKYVLASERLDSTDDSTSTNEMPAENSGTQSQTDEPVTVTGTSPELELVLDLL